MFANCSSLVSLDLSNFNTSKVTSIAAIFYSCKSFTSIGLNALNTSNVTNMYNMFANCNGLISLDLSNFNTSKVTNMSSMFSNCESLTNLDISHFDTSNVTNMKDIFRCCSKLSSLDLSNFKTSKVTDMSTMFYMCKSFTTLDFSSFNTSNVTNISFMFSGCNNLINLDLSSFDLSKITSYDYFLDSDKLIKLNSPKNNSKTDIKLPNGRWIGSDNNSYTVLPTISGESITLELVMSTIYNGGESNSFVQYIVSKISSSLTVQKISSITFSNEISSSYKWACDIGYDDETQEMSSQTSAYYTLYNGMYDIVIYSRFGKLILPEDCSYMFAGCKGLTTLNMSLCDTSRVTDMQHMFDECSSLTSLDLSNFYTSNVTDMQYMFNKCSELTSINLSSFNTENLVNISYMFNLCEKLQSLDLSSFDISNVTEYENFLLDCIALTEIKTPKVNKITDISLRNGTTWIRSDTKEGCTELPTTDNESITLILEQ